MHKTWTGLILVVFVLAAAGALAAEPLVSFEDEAMAGVRVTLARVERVQMHATHGEWAAKVVYPGNEKDSWPGMSVPLSGITLGDDVKFVVDIFNPSEKALRFSTRIDTEGKGTSYISRTINPGANKYEVSFKRADDPHAGKKVKGLFIYMMKPREDVTLYLDNLRLE